MKDNRNMSKKKDKRNLIIGIAMMVIALGISVGTYAYYQTTITGTVSGTILAWDCSGSNISVSSISLSDLKPGSSGNATFNVKSPNFKTDIAVYLKLDATTNKPANLRFCKDSSCATTIALTTAFGAANFGDNNVNKNTQKTYTLYWSWPYDGSDTPISTTSNVTFRLDWKVVCTQSSSQS